MSLLHEKRAVSVKTTLLPTAVRKNRQNLNPVESNCTRKPWSERYSTLLNLWPSVSIAFGWGGLLLGVAAILGGGHGV